MIILTQGGRMSMEDYLAADELSGPKWEYIDGAVYQRPDERNLHNYIAVNVLCSWRSRLTRSGCEAFLSATNVRVRAPGRLRAYRADGGVTLDPNPMSDHFEDKPAVLLEILSVRTRRIDEVEKRDAYLGIPSLRAYLLVEQDMPLVVVHRRAGTTFVREEHEGLDAVIPLPEIGTELPLAEIYEGIEFIPEEEGP